ncbi:MAG: AsmA family protein, partial [Parvularculaceae bacterium]
MGRFLAALVALVVLLAAIVILAPNLIPAKTYKPQIEAAATKALGRQVSIGDDLNFKFLPEPSFAVRDLVIANEEGFEGDYLAKVERADIGVRLKPLFKKRVEISRFVLTRPDIVLQKSKTGAINWNLASSGVEGGAEDQGEGEAGDVNLGDVRFIDGRATYTDAKENKTYSIDAFNATAKLSSLSEPLELAGVMNFQGAPSKIDLVLTNVSDIIAKRDSNLKIDATIGEAAIGADLTLAGGDVAGFKGPVSLNAPDLPALASLFGVKLEDAPGFDTLAINGKADGNAQSIALDAASIHFDAIEADGDIKLDWSGARPKATGSLTTDSLDMRPYMPPPTTSAEGFPAWSTAKIDFASLRNIDADLDINAGRIYLNEIEAGETRMNLKVAGGKMTASIPQLGFYGGGGSGTLVVDATRATPSI